MGNSLGVVIPKEALEESAIKEGDVIKLSFQIPRSKRKRVLKEMAGIDLGREPFVREK